MTPGGVFTDIFTDAVENGIQTSDSFSIICFRENKKGLDSIVFHNS